MKPHIEQLFEHSSLEAPRLSREQKDHMFARVMANDPSRDTTAALKATSTPFSWWKWSVVSVASGLAVLAMLVTGNINLPSGPILNPRTTPVVNTLDNPRTLASSLDELARGDSGGGVWEVRPRTWTITDKTNASDERGELTAGSFERLSQQEMERIVNAFGIPTPEIRAESQFEIVYLTNLDPAIVKRTPFEYKSCLLNRYWDDDALPQERCVFVNDIGVISFEQHENVAEQNGVDEALVAITAITKEPESNFDVRELEISNSRFSDGEIIDQEIDIVQKTIPESAVRFFPYAWHLGLKNGRLVSLTGTRFNIVALDSKTPIVSEQVAMTRFATYLGTLEYWKESGTDIDVAMSDATGKLLSTLEYERKKITLDMTAISLSYETASPWPFDDKGNRILNASPFDPTIRPVYRVQGVEANSNKPVEFLIDATVDGTGFDHMHMRSNLNEFVEQVIY